MRMRIKMRDLYNILTVSCLLHVIWFYEQYIILDHNRRVRMQHPTCHIHESDSIQIGGNFLHKPMQNCQNTQLPSWPEPRNKLQTLNSHTPVESRQKV